VRFTDPTTGFEHHGFLNVIVAVTRAIAGADTRTVVEALTLSESAPLVAEVRDLAREQATEMRRRFVSFGCCGVEDPIGDLVGLGLVNPEEPR
jgi:hypothetical protein